MLLIVTNKDDPHADDIIRRLHDKNILCFRLNTEDILSKYALTLSIECNGVWNGRIRDELGRELQISDVRVAWIRRPVFPFDKPIDGVQAFIASEVRALISCLYALPNIAFINDVFDGNRAKSKFQQLVNAAAIGMNVPRTIITNSFEEAKRFVALAEGDLLIKSIQTGNIELDGIWHGLLSKKVSRAELNDLLPLIANAPAQIQDYIEKDYELRVTVIKDKVFAVKIESQLHELTKVDWRHRTSLNPHSFVNLPDHVVEFCRRFLADQKLLFGAMDFIVNLSGEYYFLENNPSGQFLWLDDTTDAGIADALVEFIVSYANDVPLLSH